MTKCHPKRGFFSQAWPRRESRISYKIDENFKINKVQVVPCYCRYITQVTGLYELDVRPEYHFCLSRHFDIDIPQYIDDQLLMDDIMNKIICLLYFRYDAEYIAQPGESGAPRRKHQKESLRCTTGTQFKATTTEKEQRTIDTDSYSILRKMHCNIHHCSSQSLLQFLFSTILLGKCHPSLHINVLPSQLARLHCHQPVYVLQVFNRPVEVRV